MQQNHRDVLVVVDHNDYLGLLEFLKGNQSDKGQFRKMLAWKAFQHVASYDAAVSEWLWKQSSGGKFLLFGKEYSMWLFPLGTQNSVQVID